MYIKLLGFFILLNLSSCTIQMKKKNDDSTPIKKESTQAKKPNSSFEDESGTSWADNYYQETTMVVDYPKIKDSPERILEICQGEDKSLPKTYRGKFLSPIKFKTQPLILYTDSGFTKKVYVSKGICRELVLYTSKLKEGEANFRTKIKKAKLHYIYNAKTYLTELVFETQFKDVEFSVK